MCGENLLVKMLRSSCSGSPPHVRGKRLVGLEGANGFGITPACAGKTKDIVLLFTVHEDHPRMCGENHLFLHSIRKRRGSPPHVRGKH